MKPIVGYFVVDDGPPHLLATACRECGALYLGRRNGCGRCGGTSFEPRRLQDRGAVRTFTIVHRSVARDVPVPFVAAVVDFDGGGSVRANLRGVAPDPAEVKPGMRVKLVTFDAGDDVVAFAFEPEA